MNKRMCGRRTIECFELAAALSVVACLGACGTASDPTSGSSGAPSSSSGSGSGSGSASGSEGSGTESGSGSTGSAQSSGSGSTGDDSGSSDTGESSGKDGSTTAPSGADASTKDDASAPAPPVCEKGTVPPSKVVMLGDSYLDPNYGNVGNNIFADAQAAGSLAANTTYRHYYLAGAAMNNGGGLLNIPYQYDSGAKTDLAVSNPADIDVIVMDGGGNDVLIDQQSCLTVGPTQTACANAITATVARTKSLWQEMAKDGVKHIVYFFYPHLDPAGGGLLPTPSPYVNTTDDYSAPLYQQICCGSTFTPTASANTCSGSAPGTDCVYVDTRPAFDGHQTDWILSDHVHPNAMGSKVIADLVWKAMTAHCIAQ